MELRNVSGSHAGRCILSYTSIMTLWLVVTALILTFPSSCLQRLFDWTRPQKTESNRTETAVFYMKPNRNRTEIGRVEPSQHYLKVTFMQTLRCQGSTFTGISIHYTTRIEQFNQLTFITCNYQSQKCAGDNDLYA